MGRAIEADPPDSHIGRPPWRAGADTGISPQSSLTHLAHIPQRKPIEPGCETSRSSMRHPGGASDQSRSGTSRPQQFAQFAPVEPKAPAGGAGLDDHGLFAGAADADHPRLVARTKTGPGVRGIVVFAAGERFEVAGMRGHECAEFLHVKPNAATARAAIHLDAAHRRTSQLLVLTLGAFHKPHLRMSSQSAEPGRDLT